MVVPNFLPGTNYFGKGVWRVKTARRHLLKLLGTFKVARIFIHKLVYPSPVPFCLFSTTANQKLEDGEHPRPVSSTRNRPHDLDAGAGQVNPSPLQQQILKNPHPHHHRLSSGFLF